MNWVDIAIVVTVLGSTITGFFWGLIRQLVSILGLAGGIYFAGRFYEPVAEFLHPKDGGGLVSDPNWARIVAFGLVVIGFSLLLGIAGSVLRMVANLLFLGWADHLLGGLLGFITSTLLVTSMLAVATVFPVPNMSDAIKASQLAHWLSAFSPAVLALLPPEFLKFTDIMKTGGVSLP